MALPSSFVSIWKARAVFDLSLYAQGLTQCPTHSAVQKQFCEGQDEQVTKCGVLSALTTLVWQHGAHLSLFLPEIQGLIVTSGPAGAHYPLSTLQ